MTAEQNVDALFNAVITARREHLRVMARLRALETLVQDSLPESECAYWKSTLDQNTKIVLQQLLESLETQSPGFAALLDDREEFELDGLE